MRTRTMDDKNREIQIKVCLNRAEAAALARLAQAKGPSLAATVRALLHAAIAQ